MRALDVADEVWTEEEARLQEAFMARLHPQPSLDELTVEVSEMERAKGQLAEASLSRVVAGLELHGVVRLQGAWPAAPQLVDPVVESLHARYAELMDKLGANSDGKLTPESSFGFREIVHRSQGRYDMTLGDLLRSAGPEAPAGVQVMKFLMMSPLWRQILAKNLGPDYKV